MNISKSRIKCLEMCPLLFKWQYLDHKIPDIPPDVITKIGIDSHTIFDKFYDNIRLEDIPKDNPLEYFKGALDVLPQYKGIFNMFCGFQTRRWILTQNKEEFLPLFRERKIINNDESGIIDVIHIDNGEYSIIDYKSNVSQPSTLRFELNFYVKLVNDSKILDKPIKYIGAYAYKTGEIFYEEINTKSYNLMLKKIDEFRVLDFNKIDFIKTLGFQCSWCQYRISCNKLHE